MIIEDKILDISKNYYNYLMSLENVVGVGLGYKYINKIDTLEPCIHVLVQKKISGKYISSNNLIPKTYMGIKTDVIETGKFNTCVSKDAFPQKIRPLQGGVGISAYFPKAGTGTLGCIVSRRVKNDEFFYILSNNHVLADIDRVPYGSSILQPSEEHKGHYKYDVVAYLDEYVKLETFTLEKLKNPNFKPPINDMDCALAKLANNRFISNEILAIGKIKGTSKPKHQLPIKKVGMASGISYGTVTTMGTTVNTALGKDKFGRIIVAHFQNQIAAQLYAKEGDSGSVILNNKNEVVGLFFSASSLDENHDADYSLFTDINVVLKRLNVSIFTGY